MIMSDNAQAQALGDLEMEKPLQVEAVDPLKQQQSVEEHRRSREVIMIKAWM